MLCFNCIELMRSGDIEELEKVRKQCNTYINNQCQNLASDDTFVQKIQDVNVGAFSSLMREAIDKAWLPMIVVVFGLTLGLLGANIKPSDVLTFKSSDTTLSIVSEAREYEYEGDNAKAFETVSREYTYFKDAYSKEELNQLERYLLSLGVGTNTVQPSSLYGNVYKNNGVGIVKLKGVVSSVSEDRVYGSTILVSDSAKLTRESIMLNVDNVENVSIGDVITVICVPRFENITLPLLTYGWVQP